MSSEKTATSTKVIVDELFGKLNIDNMSTAEKVRLIVETQKHMAEKLELQENDLINQGLEYADIAVEGSEKDTSFSTQGISFCVKSPFTAGRVTFNSCSQAQLNDFAVIKENGGLIQPPQNGVSYEADGFWYRYHTPKTEWYKIPNPCKLEITCTGNGFAVSGCCSALGIDQPRWTTDQANTPNPF